MNAREVLIAAVEALEKMGFVVLSRSEWEAKDAELAEVRQQYVDANEARIDAEAQLANLAAENERLKQEIAATQEKLIRANDELIQRNSKALSRSEVEAIRTALEEAKENIAHWGSYASKYFQEKHGLEADIASVEAAIRKLKSGGRQPQ